MIGGLVGYRQIGSEANKDTNAFSQVSEAKKLHVIAQEKCTKCGICFDVCPDKIFAVVKKIGAYQQVPVA